MCGASENRRHRTGFDGAWTAALKVDRLTYKCSHRTTLFPAGGGGTPKRIRAGRRYL